MLCHVLRALRLAIGGYIPPAEGILRSDVVNQVLKPSFTFWTQECRPHSVSMGNAFTFVKSAVVAALEQGHGVGGIRQVLQVKWIDA
jgi:translation initiation factor eIF-2B subunit delta